jgi:hypothetical protein
MTPHYSFDAASLLRGATIFGGKPDGSEGLTRPLGTRQIAMIQPKLW